MARGVASRLNAEKLRELARTGAEVTLNRLRAEIIAIERTFPELALPQRRRALRRTVKQATARGRAEELVSTARHLYRELSPSRQSMAIDSIRLRGGHAHES
jgi:hypothetical protein